MRKQRRVTVFFLFLAHVALFPTLQHLDYSVINSGFSGENTPLCRGLCTSAPPPLQPVLDSTDLILHYCIFQMVHNITSSDNILHYRNIMELFVLFTKEFNTGHKQHLWLAYWGLRLLPCDALLQNTKEFDFQKCTIHLSVHTVPEAKGQKQPV